ncbi:MAG: HAMP domain-containing protein [Deltaproteobacteria bacterium]|nr:MAG: HAMP domain-containing protein [Deltaproteobacteria bacterium]
MARIRGLTTISARIVVAFAVLIVTFGGVSAYSVVNLSRLGRQIRLIRTGYVPLALQAKELEEKQTQLREFLDDVTAESSAARVEARLRSYLATRARDLREAIEMADALRDVPPGHRAGVADIRRQLAEFAEAIDRAAPLYDALLADPPLAGVAPRDAAARDRAQQALERLVRSETELRSRLSRFWRWQRRIVEATALHLEESESYVRQLTLGLGGLAVLLGVLVAVWATRSLLPLKRLQLAARRIAAGDYASRIDERGPAEVAELAREFNVMGRAVESRERDLVRSERLAVVGKMAASITHEVRNPLSSIGLNAELLEEELAALGGDAAGEARALCRAIQTEVDRLTSITEEYLNFARLPKPKLHPHDINAIVEQLVDFEREPLAARGATVVAELATALPRVEVDDQQLRQALLNLLRNAADALEEAGGGTVAVRTRLAPGGRRVQIEVADDGPGIPPDVVDKVFDPFFSTKDRGTGLGLALTLQIVREHGGAIEVDSAPGRGTRFVVTL